MVRTKQIIPCYWKRVWCKLCRTLSSGGNLIEFKVTVLQMASLLIKDLIYRAMNYILRWIVTGLKSANEETKMCSKFFHDEIENTSCTWVWQVVIGWLLSCLVCFQYSTYILSYIPVCTLATDIYMSTIENSNLLMRACPKVFLYIKHIYKWSHSNLCVMLS